MTATDNDEAIVIVEKASNGQYQAFLEENGPGGTRKSLCTEDSVMGCLVAVSDMYHEGVPRVVSLTTEKGVFAFKKAKVNKYLCHVYYEDGNTHGRHFVKAETVEKAFQTLLQELKEEDDQDARPDQGEAVAAKPRPDAGASARYSGGHGP